MSADLRYVYDLRTNHVFLEHKGNFRLDLMYYKRLLITLTLDCNEVDTVAYLVVTTNRSQCVTVTGTHPLESMEECVVVG